MARVSWPLWNGQPVVALYLRDPANGVLLPRTLLADTGAGDAFTNVELILSQADGSRFGGVRINTVGAGGAVHGVFPVQRVPIEVSALGVSRLANALIVPASQLPAGLDGFAAFGFLNAFSYGNFGDPTRFGLETR